MKNKQKIQQEPKDGKRETSHQSIQEEDILKGTPYPSSHEENGLGETFHPSSRDEENLREASLPSCYVGGGTSHLSNHKEHQNLDRLLTGQVELGDMSGKPKGMGPLMTKNGLKSGKL